jgi:hypothetical protein
VATKGLMIGAQTLDRPKMEANCKIVSQFNSSSNTTSCYSFQRQQKQSPKVQEKEPHLIFSCSRETPSVARFGNWIFRKSFLKADSDKIQIKGPARNS